MTLEIPTLAQIRSALAAVGGKPSRRFGQNFLTDPRLLDGIVEDAGIGAGDTVLEVGPGPGTLTAAILRRGADVVAVEVDRTMVGVLEQLVGRHTDRLTVVSCDVLSERPRLPATVRSELARATEEGGGYALVSNLPYQISATLLGDLFWNDAPRVAAVTIQREVAERLRALPGGKDYGPLSVMVQLRAGVQITRRLAPGAFWPPPKVESASVRLDPIPSERMEPNLLDLDPKVVSKVVHAAFHARRKRVANSLLLGLAPGGVTATQIDVALSRAGVDPDLRGEVLAPAELTRLALELNQLVSSVGGWG